MTSGTTIANGARGSSAAVVTPEETLRAIQAAIGVIDELRYDLGQLYARQPHNGSNTNVHPDAEFEIGESLQAVRKAYTRLLKARGVLAQEALPFN